MTEPEPLEVKTDVGDAINSALAKLSQLGIKGE